MKQTLAVAVLLILSACRKPPAAIADAGFTPEPGWLEGKLAAVTGTPLKGGTLTVRLPLEPAGLTRIHDRFNEGTMTRITVGPLYETLARVTDDGLQPLLASDWAESADHLTLTIHVKEGVTFHDGSALTSKDVKANLEAVMNPRLATAGFRATLSTLKSVTTPDARTLVVSWKEPYFLANRSLLGALPILPAKDLKGDFDTLPIHREPIGTGPFKFEAWEPGVSLTYVRADERANLDRIVFRFVKDDAAGLQLLERGELDLYLRLTPSQWRSLETDPWRWRHFKRIASLDNAYSWLGFNQREPMFRDPEVRRALALLFPAETVERVVDLGLEPRTTCPYDPEGPSCDPSVKVIPFDPREARRVLAAAGWKDTDGDGVLDRDGVKFSFAFLAAAQSTRLAKLLPLYLEPLRAAGIEARIETVDVSAYMSRVRAHDFDAMALSWSTLDREQDDFPNFHSSQIAAGNNFVGYSNPEVDQLLERIRTELDPDARHRLEREVHRRVYDDQAYLFLGRRPSLDLARRPVSGLRPSVAWYDLSRVWLSR